MGITFTIPGQPVANGRPRFARRAGGVVAFTAAGWCGSSRPAGNQHDRNLCGRRRPVRPDRRQAAHRPGGGRPVGHGGAAVAGCGQMRRGAGGPTGEYAAIRAAVSCYVRALPKLEIGVLVREQQKALAQLKEGFSDAEALQLVQ